MTASAFVLTGIHIGLNHSDTLYLTIYIGIMADKIVD